MNNSTSAKITKYKGSPTPPSPTPNQKSNTKNSSTPPLLDVFSTLNWIFKFLKFAWVLSVFVRTGPSFWSGLFWSNNVEDLTCKIKHVLLLGIILKKLPHTSSKFTVFMNPQLDSEYDLCGQIKKSFFNYNIQRLKAWRLLKKLSNKLKFFENVKKQSELFGIETWKKWQKQWTPNLNWTFQKLKLLQEMQPNWHLHVPIQIGFNMVFHYHGKEHLIASPPTNMKNWMG